MTNKDGHKEVVNFFAELDAITDTRKTKEMLHPPFGWPGGKTRSLKQILPLLPYSKMYVEPFGGSGAILLAKMKTKIEVFNDMHSGVTCFYRCLRDRDMMEKLIEWCDCTVHSREEFVCCHDTWSDCCDPIERAGRWFYMLVYSFGSLGRNFGRSISPVSTFSGKLRRKLIMLPDVHDRLRDVTIENRDARLLLDEYDSPDTVFYLDPPYVDACKGTYKDEMTIEDHRDLIAMIFKLKGFVAVSAYDNPLYSDNDWDEVHSWNSYVSMTPCAFTQNNNKKDLEHVSTRTNSKEYLYIKKAR